MKGSDLQLGGRLINPFEHFSVSSLQLDPEAKEDVINNGVIGYLTAAKEGGKHTLLNPCWHSFFSCVWFQIVL